MKETVLSSVHHLILDISRHSWFPLHSHRHGVIRRLKVLHDSLLSLFIVRSDRLLLWCVCMMCGLGNPFGEWRIYSFHKNELFASDQVQPGAWVCVGWGVSSQCLCFPEIGARYIPSDLAGSNICMMHLHTTTITTTTHNLATFCNFQFQPHPPRSRISLGGYCVSVTDRLLA